MDVKTWPGTYLLIAGDNKDGREAERLAHFVVRMGSAIA
jgi:hypothetical protein